jgi:AcrR family transcriptional regulator
MQRLDRTMRRAVLLRAAIHVANRRGLEQLTHEAVAERAQVSLSTVYRWANNRKALRRATIRGGGANIRANAARLGLE